MAILAAMMATCLSAPAFADELAPFTEEAVARGIVYTSDYFAEGSGFGLGFVDLDGRRRSRRGYARRRICRRIRKRRNGLFYQP